MTGATSQADTSLVVDLLLRWIRPLVDEKGQRWLEEKRQQIEEGAPDRVFFTAFSAVPRYTGKADLNLSADDEREADRVRSGWHPQGWSVDQAARTLLVLAIPPGDADAYVKKLDRLFSAADVGEQVALYQSLPLLPYPERFVPRAEEGLRSSIDAVFNAVALENPFPADYFDEQAWNQLVLKAVFVGSPLHRIAGLDWRANPKLARMLLDYVHERWAASRTFTPELWRLVGPFSDQRGIQDLERALASDDPLHRQAAALALSHARVPGASDVLATQPELLQRIERGELTWESLSRSVG